MNASLNKLSPHCAMGARSAADTLRETDIARDHHLSFSIGSIRRLSSAFSRAIGKPIHSGFRPSMVVTPRPVRYNKVGITTNNSTTITSNPIALHSGPSVEFDAGTPDYQPIRWRYCREFYRSGLTWRPPSSRYNNRSGESIMSVTKRRPAWITGDGMAWQINRTVLFRTDFGAAARMSAFVKVCGCRPRDGGAAHARGSGYANLQGRKPREVWRGRALDAMGISASAVCH